MEHDATNRMGTERIGKLLLEFSVPAIIGMIVNAVYNVVDRIYVGQGVSDLGIAAITVAMPLMMVIIASSVLVGVGANSLFAIWLGENRRQEVEKIMGHALVLLILISGAVAVAGSVFLDDILIRLLGASDTVFPLAKEYLRIILYGAIFNAVGLGASHFIRSDGHPRTAMLSQLVGAVANIILDPIFIFGFKWGIAGAAWATIISQVISFLWVMGYFNSRFTKLRFRFRDMKLEPGLTGRILALGFAPFVTQLAMSIIGVFQNHALDTYGGDAAVSSMGIAYSVMTIIFMPLLGLQMGAQPLIGYNYGAKKYRRVAKTYKWVTVDATLFVTVCFVLVQLLPGWFISLFTGDRGELMDMGIYCLRVSTMFFPLIGFQMLSANYFQAIGKPIQGTILSLSRQILLYLPLLLILPVTFGLTGVFAAMPAADIGSALITLLFMIAEWRRLKQLMRDSDNRT
jgi:putative MATE family efflux protein